MELFKLVAEIPKVLKDKVDEESKEKFWNTRTQAIIEILKERYADKQG